MQLVGYADRTALIPLGDNRPGDTLSSFQAFVIHETANEAAGATAEMHRRYWSPGGAGRLVSSIHFVADAAESIQLIPINEQAWHAGDVTGNTTGVGIEICVNTRAGYPMACRKAAAIVAKVLRAENKAPSDGGTIRKHGSYPGTTHKQCPQHLNAGDWGVTWAGFIALVNAAYGGTPGAPDYAAIWSRLHPDVAYNAGWGIPSRWRAELDAGRSLGAALTPEQYNQSNTVVQGFEFGWVLYHKTQNVAEVVR